MSRILFNKYALLISICFSFVWFFLIVGRHVFSGDCTYILKDVSICIEDVSAFPKIIFAINNHSEKPIRIWNTNNSWGYGNVSICIISKEHNIYHIITKPKSWLRNSPSYIVVPPKGKHSRTIDISDETLWAYPNTYKQSKPCVVCAIYAVGITDESVEYNVTTGICVSPWVSISKVNNTSQETKPEEDKYEIQAKEKIQQINKAILNYANEHHRFPHAYSTDAEGKPLLSWRVLVLPYLSEECKTLYKQFNLNEPWNSNNNIKLIFPMPNEYRSPYSPEGGGGLTNIQTIRGKNTMFPGSKGISFGDIRDGTRNTIMTVEVCDEKAVRWTSPEDFVPDENNPSNGLGLRTGSFLTGMVDGTVKRFYLPFDSDTLKAMLTPRGGERISWAEDDKPYIDK